MKIQIPNPCHENWNTMTPQQKGRFCGSCKKVVIDFTKMSDSEIFHHFKNYTGDTCGRFYETQLNTELVSLKPQKSTFWSKLVVASFTLFFVSSQNYSQNIFQKTQVIESNQLNNEDKSIQTSDNNYFQIKGKVIDYSKHSISEALVSIQGTNYSTITDTNGNFEFSIAKTEIKNQDSIILQVQKFGYTNLSLKIDFDTENTTSSYLELVLEEAVILKEEVIIETRQVITMGIISDVAIEECDSEPQIINGGAFGQETEVKVIERKNLWQRFKKLFIRK